MSLVHAVIIAGGRGERLGGVRKAEIRIGGVRLIERVAAALGPVETLMLAVGPALDKTRIPPPNPYSLKSLHRSDLSLRVALKPEKGEREAGVFCGIAVPDLDSPVRGPLAGLAAAVDFLAQGGITDGLLISSAVDTPFLPDDYVSVLMEALGAAPAAYAAWGDQFYPPNALWQLSALQDLPERVREDRAPHSLKALLRELGALEVGWQVRAAENPFANLNTVADLVCLGRRAKNHALSRLIHKRDD